MKNLSTRTRILIATSILTIAYVVLSLVDLRRFVDFSLGFDPLKPVILGILAYMLCAWVVHFKVRGERLLTILFFPALAVFSLTLFSELLIGLILGSYGQIGLLVITAVVFWLLVYVTFSTINILNVSYIKEIPLGQAARAAHFVLTLLVAYISFFLIFSNDLFLVLKEGLIFGLVFVLVYMSLWSTNPSKRQRILSAFNIASMMTMLSFILSLWPINSTYLALVLILVFYVFLGIALEIREIINRWIWIEYISVFVLIFVILFLLAEWGINGHLL